MINFNELQLVVKDKYSFVGIQKQNGILNFCLPKVFSEHLADIDTFDAKRDLFFLFYRILDKFKEICLEKGYLENKTSDRDGLIKGGQGTAITVDGEDEENIFYSKLDIIGSILNAYYEPKILSLVYRLGKSENVDHNQLHRFLHRAVFLPNGAAYLEFMDLPRQQVQFSSTDLVTMYCYLFDEIQQQLKQEVKPEIKALSEQFRENYIRADYNVFEEQYQSQVIEILKDALELIDRHTPLKDYDYWEFYEAIELFLYGDFDRSEDGDIWGINNFHTVWESMCLTDIAKTIEPANLLFLDPQWISESVKKSVINTQKLIDLSNAFEINNTQLIPDAVVFNYMSNFRSKKNKKIYNIYENNWNDYNYLTSFSDDYKRKDYIKIAAEQSQKKIHTIELLKNYYFCKGGTLNIDRCLPDNFTSYWEIEIEKLDLNEIILMFYLNHFFWKAFKCKYILDILLNKKLEPALQRMKPVFRESLFRYCDSDKITENFKSFITKIKILGFYGIKIIDIKYLQLSYLLNTENIETIKSNSIRKQFVYEYLIEKHIQSYNKNCHIVNFLSELNIMSQFWIPGYKQESLIENPQKFMDGYIDICSLDFEKLAEIYLS